LRFDPISLTGEMVCPVQGKPLQLAGPPLWPIETECHDMAARYCVDTDISLNDTCPHAILLFALKLKQGFAT
jgi:hypothetical protein